MGAKERRPQGHHSSRCCSEWLARLTHTEATILHGPPLFRPRTRPFRPKSASASPHPGRVARSAATISSRSRNSFAASAKNEPVRRAVAFTIDDGYFDQGHIAGPIFAEFDCPATIFTVRRFYRRQDLAVVGPDGPHFPPHPPPRDRRACRLPGIRFPLQDRRRPHVVSSLFSIQIQESPHEDRMACIQEMSRSGEVEIPACLARSIGRLPGTRSAAWREKGSASVRTRLRIRCYRPPPPNNPNAKSRSPGSA